MRVIIFLLAFLSFMAQAQLLQARYPELPASVGLETSLLKKSNEARVASSLPELIYDESLALAARTHAKEMADLRYFSHSSPTPGSGTPAERVANAGSSLVFVGENIAKINGDNIAEDATNGWMQSPGHRANILEPNYTHVGYGTAVDAQGFTIIAQVFGSQPFKLINALLSQKEQTTYQIVFNARANSAAKALFSYGEEQSQPTNLIAGDNSIAYVTLEQNKLYLQASVQMQSGSYLIQDGGWLNLAGNSFQPDTLATQEFLSISSVAAYPRSQRVNDVLLQFEGTQGRNLAVFINNEYQQNPMLQSGTLRVTLPDNGQNVLLGVGEVFEGNNVRIIHQVMVDRSGGQVSLVGTAAR